MTVPEDTSAEEEPTPKRRPVAKKVAARRDAAREAVREVLDDASTARAARKSATTPRRARKATVKRAATKAAAKKTAAQKPTPVAAKPPASELGPIDNSPEQQAPATTQPRDRHTPAVAAKPVGRPAHVPDAPVVLSTASVYPRGATAAFELASRLGYDGVEVMVWTETISQEAGALAGLADHYGVPVKSIHAPTLLLTQRVWGTDPWVKVDKSIELAEDVGADTVVLHPPFRWQQKYAAEFVEGVAEREQRTEVRLAVENMFPWRARAREVQAYLPGWDPTEADYEHVTLDLSHTATAGSDALAMAETLGERLTHIHLADGTGSYKDEHLVPGRGNQPCAELLERLAAQGFSGSIVIEVGTRRRDDEQRELDLAEALAFARLHFAAPAP